MRGARLQLDMSSRKKKLSVAERTEAEAMRAAAQWKQDANQRMADRRAGDRVAGLMGVWAHPHAHAHSRTLTHTHALTHTH